MVNFQVIEHLWDQASSSPSAPGCCGRRGLLLMSTPNRITFSPGRDTPINPFHTRELNAAELTELLDRRRASPIDVDAAACSTARGCASWMPGTAARSSTRRSPRAGRRRAVAAPSWLADVAAVTTGDFDLSTPSDAGTGRHRRQPRPGRDRGAAVSTAAGPGCPGLFTLVLHTHLPWLAHHGRWPVGEEWLYQSWAAAYLPLMRVLRTLAGEDRQQPAHARRHAGGHRAARRPVLPGRHASLAGQLAAARPEATTRAVRSRSKSAGYQSCTPEALRAFGIRECAEADRALDDFATLWRHGGSPLLRSLIDAGAVELLGGPLAHPFQPLLAPRLREFALREGLADAQLRLRAHARRASGRPNAPTRRAWSTTTPPRASRHFMVDGPSLHGDTALGRPVGDTDVVAFGRDLQVSYRVWSPKSGYPGHAAYRDFHTYDHLTGLKPARVTGPNVSSEDKAPYDPERADHAVDVHVADFVDVVRNRCSRSPTASGDRLMSSPPSTPNCSATGGTRARRGWSGCCGPCRRPAFGWAR